MREVADRRRAAGARGVREAPGLQGAASLDPAEVAALEAAGRAALGAARFERLVGEGFSLDSAGTAALATGE